MVHAPLSVESLLQQMVQINTVNAAISGVPFPELPLALLLESLAVDWGFQTQRLPIDTTRFNLLVTHVVDPNLPWLMFESHLDTVTVEGMIIPPFGGEIREGKLWGRGASDTKGTGASMLWALRNYKLTGTGPNNIAIAFTLDEEVGMTGVRGLIKSSFPDLPFRPLGIIVGEPTRLRPIVAHNGSLRWKLSTQGVAAHSMDPSRGRSAISDMCRLIDAIESSYIPSLTKSHALSGKAQCSINIIRGGIQANVIPSSCEVVIDRRVVPGEDPDAVLPAVQLVLDQAMHTRPGMKIAQEVIFSCPPLSDHNNHHLLAFVQKSLSALHIDTTPRGAGYATDGGDLNAAGFPVIVIGPGDIAQAHTKDEFIELSQLHLGVQAYQAMMATPSVE